MHLPPEKYPAVRNESQDLSNGTKIVSIIFHLRIYSLWAWPNGQDTFENAHESKQFL